MQTYRYQALDHQGRTVTGEIKAAGAEDARARLMRIGLTLTEFADGATVPERLTKQDFHRIGGHVAEIVQAGLPLAAGLRALAEEASQARLRRGLNQVAEKLEAGVDLETALQSHGAPADLCSLIRTGARLGRTESILHEYTIRLQNAMEARTQIRTALVYPLLLIGFDAAFVVFLFVYLLPQFKKLFTDFGTELPSLTKFFLWISDLLVSDLPWILIGVAVTACVGFALIGTFLGKAARRRCLYRMPLIGPVLQYTTLAGYSHLLAFLVEQHVPLPEALVMAGNGTADPDLQDGSRRLADAVSRGEPLENAAFRLRRFPPIFVTALGCSQQPNAFATSLHATGDLLQYQAKMQASLTHRLAAPVLVIFTGITFFFFVTAMFVPLIKLLNDLS